MRNKELYAFDEFQQPYRLDLVTLETRGYAQLGMLEHSKILSAHSKIDRKTDEWLFFGLEFGAKLILHIVIFDRSNRLKRHQKLELPRNVYVHDFFVSDRHIIINLPPVDINILDYILGRRSILGSMRWKPEKGNKIMVFQRGSNAEPLLLETEASWMWHSINAFYEFGRGKYCSEPVFAQIPHHRYAPEKGEELGWLLTEVYDSRKHKTVLAIFRANHISEGPLAQAYLHNPIPLGFHGYWHPNFERQSSRHDNCGNLTLNFTKEHLRAIFRY